MGWIQVKAIIAHWFPLLYWKCNHGGEMFLQGGREHFYKMTGSLYFYLFFFFCELPLVKIQDLLYWQQPMLWPRGAQIFTRNDQSVFLFVCFFDWIVCSKLQTFSQHFQSNLGQVSFITMAESFICWQEASQMPLPQEFSQISDVWELLLPER